MTGLLGAFMGTFSGTLNAAQAYICKRYLSEVYKSTASNRKIISMNYLSGIGSNDRRYTRIFAKDVNSILQWMIGALLAGVSLPTRSNGIGGI